MRNKVLIFLSLIVVLIFSQKIAIAEDSTTSAVEKYHITFPIVELGNCTNLTECKTYCNNPQNKEACVKFAKSKGFYNPTQVNPHVEEILKKAKELLGCSTIDECKKACILPENKDKCSALTSNVPPPAKAGTPSTLMDKMAICSDFCMSHPDLCSKGKPENNPKPPVSSNSSEIHLGPGGCNSAQSCAVYCREHKEECINLDTKSLRFPPQTATFSAGVKGISIGPNWLLSKLYNLLGI